MTKLSTKIAFIIFAFAFISMVAISVVLFSRSEKLLKDVSGEYQASLAEGTLASIERGFRNRIQETEEVASLDAIRGILNKNADQQDSDSRTKSLAHVLPSAIELSILDNAGKIISSSDVQKNGTLDTESTSLDLQHKTLRYSRTSSSNLFKNADRESSVFLVMSPIKEKETGTIIGFVKIIFSSDFIHDEIHAIAGQFKAYLVDQSGNVLKHNREDSANQQIFENAEKIKNAPIIKIAQSGISRFAEEDSLLEKGESFYGIARENQEDERDENGWIILIEKEHDALFAPIRNSILLMIFIVALFVFGCAIGAVFFTQITISDPLNNIIDAIKKIPVVGEYQAPTIKTNDEIFHLNTAFVATFKELSKLKITLESRVASKTSELEKIIQETSIQNESLEKTKRAMINILDDAKELEGFITNEKNKAEAIIASMGEGLIMVDEEYKVTLINQVTENILGLTKEEMMGHSLKDVLRVIKKTVVLSDEDRPISHVLKTGQSVSAGVSDEFYGKTIAREFPVAFIVSPVKDSVSGEVVGAVAIFRDITDDKRLNDAKTNFISVASHQLRTPLTSMRWFSEMLLDGDAGKLEEEQAHFVQRIQDSAERMVNLVNLLLQIARIEAGRIMVEPTPVSLKDLSAEIAESISVTIKAKLQKVEIETDPANMPKILLDKDIVWQVIQNLLTNANRYGSPKSAIKISIIKKEDNIIYSIHNDGIGIPEKQQERIFEKFFRADNAVRAVPEGSGLGLSLIKSVVNSWGGKVWFESEENKGATFYFTIPAEGMKPKKGEVKLSI